MQSKLGMENKRGNQSNGGKKKRKRKKKIIEVKQSPEKSFEKKENEKDYS